MASKKTPKKTPAKTPNKVSPKDSQKKISTPKESPKQVSQNGSSVKTPKTKPEKKSSTIESPYVSYEKLKEAIEVVKKLSEMRNKEKEDKIPLIEDQTNQMVKLQIAFKKTPHNKTTYINLISLPNHWRHESNYETCLIVKDLDKTPLTDRELDLDQTKDHYKELLSKDNSDQLVEEILPMRELRNEYKVIEAKQRLSKAFDAFLCDKRLLHNKFDYLSRFLGKTFWSDAKKVPIPVDLSSTSLKEDMESKLNKTTLYISGKGDNSTVNIGLLKQSTDKLADNLLAITKKLSELYSNNVRSLSVKTDKSIAITFFLDCGFISEVKLDKNMNENKPIEDDFSHFLKSNVQIFKDGSIKVVPKAAKDIDKDCEDIDDIETKYLSMNSKRREGKRKTTFRYNNPNKKFKRRVNNKTNEKKSE